MKKAEETSVPKKNDSLLRNVNQNLNEIIAHLNQNGHYQRQQQCVLKRKWRKRNS